MAAVQFADNTHHVYQTSQDFNKPKYSSHYNYDHHQLNYMKLNSPHVYSSPNQAYLGEASYEEAGQCYSYSGHRHPYHSQQANTFDYNNNGYSQSDYSNGYWNSNGGGGGVVQQNNFFHSTFSSPHMENPKLVQHSSGAEFSANS